MHVAEMGLHGNKRTHVPPAMFAKSEQSDSPVRLVECAYLGCMSNTVQLEVWKWGTYLLTQIMTLHWTKQSLCPFLKMSRTISLSNSIKEFLFSVFWMISIYIWLCIILHNYTCTFSISILYIPLYNTLLHYADIRDDIGKRNIRHKFSDVAQRMHFVTRRDILNLSWKINHLSKIQHENDAQSVHQLVNELRAETYDPILCYKPQGSTDPTLCHLTKDSFILALQTEFQKDLYERFAQTIVCIDSNHKTNSHGFQLITVLVADEYGEGKYYYKNLIHYLQWLIDSSHDRTASGLVYCWQGGWPSHAAVPQQTARALSSCSSENSDDWWWYITLCTEHVMAMAHTVTHFSL